jgi:hypothetical protein
MVQENEGVTIHTFECEKLVICLMILAFGLGSLAFGLRIKPATPVEAAVFQTSPVEVNGNLAANDSITDTYTYLPLTLR